MEIYPEVVRNQEKPSRLKYRCSVNVVIVITNDPIASLYPVHANPLLYK